MQHRAHRLQRYDCVSGAEASFGAPASTGRLRSSLEHSWQPAPHSIWHRNHFLPGSFLSSTKLSIKWEGKMKTFSKVNSQKIHVPHILSQETPGGCSQTNDSTKNEKAGLTGKCRCGDQRGGKKRYWQQCRRRTAGGQGCHPDARGLERPSDAPWGRRADQCMRPYSACVQIVGKECATELTVSSWKARRMNIQTMIYSKENKSRAGKEN